MKANCQPQCKAIQGTVSGASMAPTFAPELNIPVANDLSFFGKYSAVAFIAAGKLPASPNANTARETMKPNIETGITRPTAEKTPEKIPPISMEYACIMAANDQMIIAQVNPFFVPNLSIKGPANNMDMA